MYSQGHSTIKILKPKIKLRPWVTSILNWNRGWQQTPPRQSHYRTIDLLGPRGKSFRAEQYNRYRYVWSSSAQGALGNVTPRHHTSFVCDSWGSEVSVGPRGRAYLVGHINAQHQNTVFGIVLDSLQGTVLHCADLPVQTPTQGFLLRSPLQDRHAL